MLIDCKTDQPQLINVILMPYPPAMGLAKYLVCMQLQRVFSPWQWSSSSSAASSSSSSSRNCGGGVVVRWALNILIAVTITYYTATFFAFTFSCVPREKIWNPDMQGGHCIDTMSTIVVVGVINLLLDLGILAVPIWAIWHLQMPLKRKLGVMAVFDVGVL
ncbi:hypothetical protein AAL_05222 [Moelleriella libera RCEF 2490]|uniref:Rhodopsin domain-containing protein n=1 Tax=Moelleriella libera RCEF 2490 TaxID=1081109 RepID=A0A168ARQ4_9HYPO|nr:hypothetical protein AAL_05222 [Moelleriella libera RCEF 2490]